MLKPKLLHLKHLLPKRQHLQQRKQLPQLKKQLLQLKKQLLQLKKQLLQLKKQNKLRFSSVFLKEGRECTLPSFFMCARQGFF